MAQTLCVCRRLSVPSVASVAEWNNGVASATDLFLSVVAFAIGMSSLHSLFLLSLLAHEAPPNTYTHTSSYVVQRKWAQPGKQDLTSSALLSLFPSLSITHFDTVLEREETRFTNIFIYVQ